jgi:hypothetical protein
VHVVRNECTIRVAPNLSPVRLVWDSFAGARIYAHAPRVRVRACGAGSVLGVCEDSMPPGECEDVG